MKQRAVMEEKCQAGCTFDSCRHMQAPHFYKFIKFHGGIVFWTAMISENLHATPVWL